MQENIKAKNRIKSCVFNFWKNKKIDFTKALALPVVYNPVLDETLDTVTLKLTDLRQKDFPEFDVSVAFEPGTEVVIIFEDENGRQQETVLEALIARDDCRMQRKDDTPYRSYQHTIQLVEMTKDLERLSVDTLTFNNPIPRKYDTNANASWTIV